VTFKVAKRV